MTYKHKRVSFWVRGSFYFGWYSRTFIFAKLYPDRMPFSLLYPLLYPAKIKTWHDTKQLFLTMEPYLQVSNANRMRVVCKKKSRRPWRVWIKEILWPFTELAGRMQVFMPLDRSSILISPATGWGKAPLCPRYPNSRGYWLYPGGASTWWLPFALPEA